MKKTILSFFALSSFAFAQAQTTAGAKFVGGTLGINTSKSKSSANGTSVDGPKSTSFTLAPQFGYFLADQLAVVGRLSISTQNNTSYSYDVFNGKRIENTDKTSRFGLGVGVRKYLTIGDKVSFFGELGLGIYSGKNTNEYNGVASDPSKVTVFTIGITPGIIFFPTDKIGIEASIGAGPASTLLGFQSTSEKYKENKTTVNEFGFGAGSLGLNFGFNYFF